MKAFVLLLVLLSVVLGNQEAWLNFMSKYNKSYKASEYQTRYAIFAENLKLAAGLQEADPSARYGVTKFSDLTPEEFAQSYLMPKALHANRPFPAEGHEDNTVFQNVEVPESYDWRSKNAVTAVYNQGQCGSCWAFSATETVESYGFLNGGQLNHLAMQQIVDCDTTAYGCNGGWTYAAYNYLEKAGGQDSLSSYPYTAENGQCQFNPANVLDVVNSWSYVTQSADEEKMLNWAYQTGPLSVCADASSWQFYNGGVIQNCGTQIDHCIQVTGFSTQNGIKAWNVRNSWGTDWGNSGYLYVERGNNVCAIGDVVTAAKVSMK